MKYIFSIVLITLLTANFVFAATQHNIESANFIASKWVINNNETNITEYNLDSEITRREMLKVMMNLSWREVVDTCTWKFSDMRSDDWGCKYAEAAVDAWFIAKNNTFRPDDKVTQIESLKMIMQAKGIARNESDDWRDGYMSKAQSEGIIEESFIDYDKTALRGWIFSNAARSYSDFKVTIETQELTPEEEELFNFLLNGITWE